ncbi:MAG: hypothetical protein M0P12_00690 [Paludibacteraceae bacterium]|nr:hypothetical protein [Paludibacteraceae bacterium]
MVEEKSWEEFKNSKMLWFVNRLIHIFGWAIVIEASESGDSRAFPARVKFRGFSEKVEDEGFIGISQFMKDNAEELLKESKE